jgi:hypothetical protein
VVRLVLQGRRFSRASSGDNALASLGTGIGAAMKRLGSMLQPSRSDTVARDWDPPPVAVKDRQLSRWI